MTENVKKGLISSRYIVGAKAKNDIYGITTFGYRRIHKKGDNVNEYQEVLRSQDKDDYLYFDKNGNQYTNEEIEIQEMTISQKKSSMTICDRCDKYEVSPCGTSETCHAFIDRQTRFKNGITKDYIEQRIIGEKNHCKEYKPIKN